MSKLTSYTCKECGGVLNFDSDQDVFGCPFCGNKFNYADFHRKELLKQAEQNLKRCEYRIAEEKYKEVLVNAPYNLEARLGLVYCAGKITDKSDLKDPKKMMKYDPAHSREMAENFASDSKGEDAVCFSKLTALLALAAEYKDNSDEISKISSMTVTKLDNMRKPVNKAEEIRRMLFQGDLVFGTLITIFIFSVALTQKDEAVGGFGFLFLLIVVVAGIILSFPFEDLFPTFFMKKEKKYRDDKHEIIEGSMLQTEELRKRLREIELLYPDVFRELENSIPAKSMSDNEMQKTPYKPKEVTSFDLKEQILCSKCGGRLTIDKNRNFLLCSSCGVAYGTSLFFGEPKKKAYESLGKHEYAEADQRFLQVLMRDPHDFEALRGRILSVGKWGKNWEKDELSIQWVQTLQKRVDAALKDAREEDYNYFMEYKVMADLYAQKRDAENGINHIKKEHPELYERLKYPKARSSDPMFQRLKESCFTMESLIRRLDKVCHEIDGLDRERKLPVLNRQNDEGWINMSKLTSYTCRECGGVLNFDSDQKLFGCPFCGTAFDMVDFHRNEILNSAYTCLKRNEYISAVNKFNELYSKDPHDFDALQGLILCAGEIPDKADLVNPRYLIRHDIEKAQAALEKYAGDCAGYPYFAKLAEVFPLSVEYQRLIIEKGSLDRALKDQIKKLKDSKARITDIQFKRITEENRTRTDYVNKRIKELESILSAKCSEIKDLMPEAPDYSVSMVNKTEFDPQNDSVSDIVCIKCGGQLVHDKKRNLYECRACGVAYGTSLFGAPNKKGGEALERNEFSEAEQWYSYMLMLDPHNFEALRGRLLCSAKWTRVSENAEVSNFIIKNLRSQAESAVESALEHDKPYFTNYIKLADNLSGLLDEDNKIKSLSKKRDKLVDRSKRIVVDFDTGGDNPYIPISRETITRSIYEINMKIRKAENSRGYFIKHVKKLCSEINSFDYKRSAKKTSENN